MGETFIHDAAPQPLPSLPGAGVGSWHLGSSSEHVPTPQALDPQLSFARQELPTVLGLSVGHTGVANTSHRAAGQGSAAEQTWVWACSSFCQFCGLGVHPSAPPSSETWTDSTT